MRILVACEESQRVCKELRKLGHEAYSCDILPCSGGKPKWHLRMDLAMALYLFDWDMIIAFPPCTFLTVSANKWLKDQPKRKSGTLVGEARREARREAIEFFMMIANHPCKKICIENPVGIMSTEYRKPDQIIQPWMFGHGETKATCLWLKGLPKLFPTKIVKGRKQKVFKMSPSKDRSKLRSKTYLGIARALATQFTQTEI